VKSEPTPIDTATIPMKKLKARAITTLEAGEAANAGYLFGWCFIESSEA
jgi:hypothetical protein